MKKKLVCYLSIFLILLFNACKTKGAIPVPEKVEPKIIEAPKENKNKIEGTYMASFFLKKDKILTYVVQFFENKTAKLMIFKNKNVEPTVFKGFWLETKEKTITLYFKDSILSSEFFKKRPDGNLSILKEDKTEFEGELYEYMTAIKIQ